MMKGISPTVYVSDLDKSVAFYRDVLGLQVLMHIPGHWAGLAAPDGTNVGLHPAGPHSPKPGTGGSIQIGFLLDEPLDKVVADLTKRGVTFHGPIKDDVQVRLAFFGDPDGNHLYLCELKWGAAGGGKWKA